MSFLFMSFLFPMQKEKERLGYHRRKKRGKNQNVSVFKLYQIRTAGKILMKDTRCRKNVTAVESLMQTRKPSILILNSVKLLLLGRRKCFQHFVTSFLHINSQHCYTVVKSNSCKFSWRNGQSFVTRCRLAEFEFRWKQLHSLTKSINPSFFFFNSYDWALQPCLAASIRE